MNDCNNENNEKNKVSNIDDSNWLELEWNYFELLSNQRMQIMNYFITISVVLIGAFFTLIKSGTSEVWMKYICLIGLLFISLTFFLIDRRTRTMLHSCEDCIKNMENRYLQIEDNNHRYVFHHIDSKTKKYHLTYSKIFLFQYFFIALMSIVGMIFVHLDKI